MMSAFNLSSPKGERLGWPTWAPDIVWTYLLVGKYVTLISGGCDTVYLQISNSLCAVSASMIFVSISSTASDLKGFESFILHEWLSRLSRHRWKFGTDAPLSDIVHGVCAVASSAKPRKSWTKFYDSRVEKLLLFLLLLLGRRLGAISWHWNSGQTAPDRAKLVFICI